MAQKKREDLEFKRNVDVILKCLYAIKDEDQFYFMTYGKDWIDDLVEHRVKELTKD